MYLNGFKIHEHNTIDFSNESIFKLKADTSNKICVEHYTSHV